MTEGKIWGKTERIYSSESVSVHVLEISKGGYSSRHRHHSKVNVFRVLSGEVILRVWPSAPPSQSDETRLLAGDSATVCPGVWHQFDALKDSVMIEIYGAFLSGEDIQRATRGGIRREPAAASPKSSSSEWSDNDARMSER